jgi:hypothetical protein
LTEIDKKSQDQVAKRYIGKVDLEKEKGQFIS